MLDPSQAGAVAHVIQLAVAPVFLLTAIGTLLSVLTNRLSRIIDRARVWEARLVGASSEEVREIHGHLAILSHRAKLIGRAIALATATALLICTVIAILFLGQFCSFDNTLPVAVFFIVGMLSLMVALVYFLREIYIATATLRIGPN
jgi:hypothetical protein